MKSSNARAILQTIVHFIEEEDESELAAFRQTGSEYTRGYVNGLRAVKRELKRLDRNF